LSVLLERSLERAMELASSFAHAAYSNCMSVSQVAWTCKQDFGLSTTSRWPQLVLCMGWTLTLTYLLGLCKGMDVNRAREMMHAPSSAQAA